MKTIFQKTYSGGSLRDLLKALVFDAKNPAWRGITYNDTDTGVWATHHQMRNIAVLTKTPTKEYI